MGGRFILHTVVTSTHKLTSSFRQSAVWLNPGVQAASLSKAWKAWSSVMNETYVGVTYGMPNDKALLGQGAEPPRNFGLFGCLNALILLASDNWNGNQPPHPCIMISRWIYSDLKGDKIWSPRGWNQHMGWKIGTLKPVVQELCFVRGKIISYD